MAYGGKAIYGARIGILMLEARFPRIPGDVGNATTFSFPDDVADPEPPPDPHAATSPATSTAPAARRVRVLRTTNPHSWPRLP